MYIQVPDAVVAVQVQVQIQWVKALKKQQAIKIHPKKEIAVHSGKTKLLKFKV